LKGYLGIIFLVDLLLLRIEIDNTKIQDCDDEIKNINQENSLNNYQRTSTLVSTESNYNNYPNSNVSPYLLNKAYNEENNIFKNIPELQNNDRSTRESLVNSTLSINRNKSPRVVSVTPSLNRTSYKTVSITPTPTSPSNRSSFLPGKSRRNSNISNIISEEYIYKDDGIILKPEYPININNKKVENGIGKRKSLIEESNKLFR